MSTDKNKEVVIHWLEACDKGNWGIINELFALEDCTEQRYNAL